MKKYLFLMIALVGLVGMSGCKKTEIIEREINSNRTIISELPPSAWRSINNGQGWEVELNVPEINSDVFEYDNVAVHLMFEDEIYEPLTTVYEGVAYRYDYAVGNILIDAKWADGGGGAMQTPPPTRWVKIILSESREI